jgi:hypothetical protein
MSADVTMAKKMVTKRISIAAEVHALRANPNKPAFRIPIAKPDSV